MISLPEFYFKYQKHIALAQAWVEEKQLSFIIKGCRLKPLIVLQNKKLKKTELYYHWIDEYNNSLKINKDKELEIIQNDLSLKDAWPNNIKTDLYAGLSTEKIILISKAFYILLGKTEGEYRDHFIISFIGIDDFLRTFIYLDDEWKSFPSLLLGIKTLHWMGKFRETKKFKKIPQSYPIVIPCQKQEVWLSSCPAGKDFLALIKEKNLPGLDFLNN